MINIKSFVKHRNSTAVVTTNSQSGSSSSSTTSPANDWFYYNNDSNAVVCKYDLHSVGNIVAFAYSGETGGGGNTSSGGVTVVDNLTSYSTTYALSANQGRVIKSLIDNIQTQSGGQQFTGTVDWSNVTNKPSSFNPSAHTHSISDVNDLQSNLTNLQNNISTTNTNLNAHTSNTQIHLTSTEKTLIDGLSAEMLQFITKLMNTLTIDNNGNCTFNGNVNSRQNVTALV